MITIINNSNRIEKVLSWKIAKIPSFQCEKFVSTFCIQVQAITKAHGISTMY